MSVLAMFVMASVAILAAIAAGGVLAVIGRPKSFVGAPRPVLICVAHSDDCVIAGAEYAKGALAAGLSVQVFYMTCGADTVGSELAAIRRMEAIAAWRS